MPVAKSYHALPWCGCTAIIAERRRYLPLTSLSAHATIFADTSKCTLTQTYTNDTSGPLDEVRYTFPLYDGVSVVSFTCTVGARVIRGVVKERSEAKKTYDEAVSRGQTAGLLEQSLDAADVFTTLVGNVPARETVKVDITYLGELQHDAQVDGTRFTIPTIIAPRYCSRWEMNTWTQAIEHSAPPGKIDITVDVDLGCVIKAVQSPSHPVSVTIGTTSANPEPSLYRASASLGLDTTSLDKDFVVQVVSTGPGEPKAVLETHATLPNQRALMTTLVPKFNLAVEKPEIVFVCDRSGSMGDDRKMPNLKSALNIFLKSLPLGVDFNICSFGSRFSFLWKQSMPYDQDSLKLATDHVAQFDANFGGTEMLAPVLETCRRRKGKNLEVILLTDGEIWDQVEFHGMIKEQVKLSKGAIRMFSLGVGAGVSHALINGVARGGGGFAQTAGEDERLDKKIVRMLKGALTPHITDYRLEVKYQEDDGFEFVERVMDGLTIRPGKEAKPAETEEQPTAATKPTKPISLFDTTVADEDMQVPVSQPHRDLPTIEAPRYLQTPAEIPALYPFIRTTVYVMLDTEREPTSVILRGSCSQGPLELEIPVTKVTGTTIHQMAAKKAIQELEEGGGWLRSAKRGGKLLSEEFPLQIAELEKREAVRLGVRYQVGGKWCSFVAVDESGQEQQQELQQQEHDDADADADVVQVAGKRSRAGALGLKQKKAKVSLPSFARRMSAAPKQMRASQRQASQRQASQAQMHGIQQFQPQMQAFQQQGFQAQMSYAPPPRRKRGGGMPDSASPRRDRCMMAGMAVQQSAPADEVLNHEVEEDEEEDMDNDMDMAMGFADSFEPPSRARARAEDSGSVVERLATLQAFDGSWSWSQELEDIIGIKEGEAKAAKVPADLLATVCVIAYLRRKQADEHDVWELMVDKAEAWIGRDLEGLEALQRKVVDAGLVR